MLKSKLSFLTPLGFVRHGCEDRNKFICFLVQLLNSFAIYPAVFLQEFNPELGFISFLQQPIELGTEFGI